MIGSALTYAWHEIFNFKLILFSPFFLHVYAHFIFYFGFWSICCLSLPFGNTFSRYLYNRKHTHTHTFTLTILCISISLFSTFTCTLFLFLFPNRLTCSELSLIILSLISRETDDIDEDSADDVDVDDDDDNDDGMNATLTTTFVRIMTYVAFLLPFETLLNVCYRNVNPYRITL